MKEQKLYVCEYCGTQYKNKDNALTCEARHHPPVKIINAAYHAAKSVDDGYPDRIEVKFSDGKTIWYKR